MPALPAVRVNSQALYPVTRRIVCATGITLMANGSEQRWKRRAPLFEFALQYSQLKSADRDAIVNAFNAQKGEYGTNLSFTLGTQTYSNLVFVDDVLDFKTDQVGYTLQLKLRQTQNLAYAVPAVSAVFPTLSTGVITQYPFTGGHRNVTTAGDSPTGTRYPYAWYGAGLSGFPTRALRRWILATSLIADADVTTLENFFVGMQGRLTTFSLTDPDNGVMYPNCRFDTDTMEIHYISKRQSSVSFAVIETN